MTYAAYITEGIYQGLHGIEQKEILIVSCLKEAHEIATEMSLELMGSYSAVYEELETMVQDEIDANWTEEEVEKLRAEIYNENVYYDLYELDEEKIKDKSYEDLEEELYNDLEEFLNKYQKEV